MELILNETTTCESCNGTGGIKIESDGTPTEGQCEKCKGRGIIIDNFVGDLLKEIPGMTRQQLPVVLGKIYSHYKQKLEDSYKRGFKDGSNQPPSTS